MRFLKIGLAAAIVVGSMATASEAFAMPVSNVAAVPTADVGQGGGVQKVWWRNGYGWRRPYGYGWRRPWIYGYGPGRRWGGRYGYGYGWHNRRLLGSRAR